MNSNFISFEEALHIINKSIFTNKNYRLINGVHQLINFENDKKKGKSKPGIMVDPIPYQSCTTEGKLKTKISEIKQVTTRPC